MRIEFGEWLFNSGTIIVAGQPNAAFWQVGEQVQKRGAELSLALRMPWGARVTAGRFTATGDHNTVEALRQCLQSAPILEISAPTAIDVGYYTNSVSGSALYTTRTFNTSQPVAAVDTKETFVVSLRIYLHE